MLRNLKLSHFVAAYRLAAETFFPLMAINYRSTSLVLMTAPWRHRPGGGKSDIHSSTHLYYRLQHCTTFPDRTSTRHSELTIYWLVFGGLGGFEQVLMVPDARCVGGRYTFFFLFLSLSEQPTGTVPVAYQLQIR